MVPKDEILKLRDKGLSYGKIAEMLDCPKATVAWTCKNPDRPAKDVRSYDWNAIRTFYDEGNGPRACIRHFGMSARTWDKAVRRGVIVLRPKGSHVIPLDELLVSNRPQTSRTHLKGRLIKEGLLKEKCSVCGIVDWMGRPLSLHLDHINGKPKDNRIENLRLICPNCHSQTETYSGKNVKKQLMPP